MAAPAADFDAHILLVLVQGTNTLFASKRPSSPDLAASRVDLRGGCLRTLRSIYLKTQAKNGNFTMFDAVIADQALALTPTILEENLRSGRYNGIWKSSGTRDGIVA